MHLDQDLHWKSLDKQDRKMGIIDEICKLQLYESIVREWGHNRLDCAKEKEENQAFDLQRKLTAQA